MVAEFDEPPNPQEINGCPGVPGFRVERWSEPMSEATAALQIDVDTAEA